LNKSLNNKRRRKVEKRRRHTTHEEKDNELRREREGEMKKNLSKLEFLIDL
jgi:hypothetical protein